MTRHLLCPCGEGIMLEIELFMPASFTNSFVNSKLIKLGRDPEIGERLNFLAPTDIVLSTMGDEGAYLVLDTAKSSVFRTMCLTERFVWIYAIMSPHHPESAICSRKNIDASP